MRTGGVRLGRCRRPHGLSLGGDARRDQRPAAEHQRADERADDALAEGARGSDEEAHVRAVGHMRQTAISRASVMIDFTERGGPN